MSLCMLGPNFSSSELISAARMDEQAQELDFVYRAQRIAGPRSGRPNRRTTCASCQPANQVCNAYAMRGHGVVMLIIN